VLVLVLDKFWSNRDLKMLCTGMSSKHHSWEPEVEVILSVTVSFIILCTQMWAYRQLPVLTVLIRYYTTLVIFLTAG